MTWQVTTLGELVGIKHGFAFKGEHFSDAGKHILLTPGNCHESGGLKLKGEKEKYYTGEIPEDYLLSAGDLLVVMTDLVNTAPILGGAFLIPEDDKYLHNQRLGLVHIKDEKRVSKKYLYYLFNTGRYRGQVRGSASGATVRHTSPDRIKQCEVSIPSSTSEQERIASVLSAYDDLIENNRRRIHLLEQAARLLYKEWFVHLRFPGHEHVKIKDGVPEGWEKMLLGDIASTNAESYQARELPDEINYIDISSVTQGHIISKTLLSSAEAPGRARRKSKNGDVIWSNVRPNLRAYALVLDPEENDVFSTGFTVLSPEGVPFTYLYLTVTTDEFVSHLVNHATGVSYPAVRPDDFERAAVLVPPKQILEVFQEKTEPSYRLKSVLEKEIKALAKARDILLPRLMNEEIAV